jgi:cytochrome c oxidase cbb3-type subunit 3
MRRRTGLITLLIGIVIIVAAVHFSPAAAQECDDPEVIALGASVYIENCAVCHGEDGQGRIGATLAKDWPSIRPDLRVRETIANGAPGALMPAWSQANGGPLTEEEIDAATCYILSWQTGEPFVPIPLPTQITGPVLTPPPGVTGDPNNGAALYQHNCAVCHGTQGEGRIGATLARDWPSFRPDLRVKSVISSGVEDAAMPAWSQANGGPLTEDEIDDITAYILSWESAQAIEPSPTPEPSPGFLSGWPLIIILVVVFVAILVIIWYFSRGGREED